MLLLTMMPEIFPICHVQHEKCQAPKGAKAVKEGLTSEQQNIGLSPGQN